MPHHNLANFKPCLEYTTEGKTVGGEPLPNTSEGPHFRPQPQPLHFVVGRTSSAMIENGKLDRIEERLRVIEGSGDYAFANMAELCLVLDVIIPLKFKVTEFDKCKGTTWPKNHLKLQYQYNSDMALDRMQLQSIQEGAQIFQEAKRWLHSFKDNSLKTWDEVVEKFLKKYFPESKTVEGKAAISSFHQFIDESLSEALERFRGLLRKTPTHGFS
ncbi:uncharacterized protein [Glycine max]|uniref:uncharacterized protein n=1 Tax=Glycine max TaxID=3847 RepID=UPI0003DEA7A9|nr:uncharacterized protein LOC102659847 [Glycine max]|eukprot:XP_006591677.1 uncharacterized protein LOC102659847 [Glycine max]